MACDILEFDAWTIIGEIKKALTNCTIGEACITQQRQLIRNTSSPACGSARSPQLGRITGSMGQYPIVCSPASGVGCIKIFTPKNSWTFNES